MIYLDTNVVLWLAAAQEQLSSRVVSMINNAESLFISPMVQLELEYLHEIGRLGHPSTAVLAHLRAVLNLRTCDRAFGAVVEQAAALKWTRDPFDRLITAQAALGNDSLLTRDKIIRANYEQARW
jgi:PIN domain nuclease of toxin-antitoxin system